jgi:hypothetical protein
VNPSYGLLACDVLYEGSSNEALSAIVGEGVELTPWLWSASELCRPSERPPLLGEVVPTFADRGCCVVSAADPPRNIRHTDYVNGQILIYSNYAA